MDIELRDIDSINPYEKNPCLNDDAVDAVAESIREFGFRQPVVVGGAGVIICGHTRWKAAEKLQLAKVPVYVATDLTPEQVKAYRIADTRAERESQPHGWSEPAQAGERQHSRPPSWRSGISISCASRSRTCRGPTSILACWPSTKRSVYAVRSTGSVTIG